jgi:serine/threonine-protein kinase
MVDAFERRPPIDPPFVILRGEEMRPMSSSSERTAAGTVVAGRVAAPTASGTAVMSQGAAAFGATVARDPRAAPTGAADFAATQAAESGHGSVAPPQSASAWRSTVLPKPRADGARPELVHSDRPRYERQRLLGEGGMGEVVRSIDNDIERTVAIKRLKGDLREPAHVARFVDEIRTVGSMEHPNIVPIHDVGVDEQGQYYFVMKYVDGETLEAILERLRAGDAATHAEYGFERRVEIFLGVLEAVAYAHARGIIHRDIKPANVMIGRYGEVTVMDWGIARLKTKADITSDHAGPSDPKAPFGTLAGTLIGTPAYMSPEQARAEALDERSDVYSLSVLFHEMLTMTHYLDGATTLEQLLEGVKSVPAKHPVVTVSPFQPAVPTELSHFVMKGTAKDPRERFASVDEMIDRLRRRAGGDFPIQCPTTFTKRTTHRWLAWVDRHPYFSPAVFLGGILVTAIALGDLVLRFAR